MDLATTINQTIDAAVQQAGKGKTWLSTCNDSTSSYALDTNCWAYGLSSNNFRSRAVWNSYLTRSDGPTLIAQLGQTSTQFAVAANHFTPNGIVAGATVRYLKADGTTLTATIAGTVQIGSTDIRLIMFTAPMNAFDVGSALLLPANFTDYVNFAYHDRAGLLPFGQHGRNQGKLPLCGKIFNGHLIP